MELHIASPSHPLYRATCCKANTQLRTHQPLKLKDIMEAKSLSQLLSSVPGAPDTTQLTPETKHNYSSSTDHADVAAVKEATDQSSSTVGERQPLPVLCTDQERHRFLVCDDTKNVFGSDYHVRVPESRGLRMPISEIRHCVRTWTTSRLLLQVSGITGDNTHAPQQTT